MHVEQLIKAIKAHIAEGDHAKDRAEQGKDSREGQGTKKAHPQQEALFRTS
jgi:hypothetical protein